MPIFEYKCQGCGHQFEKMVRGSETATCPSCEGAELEKLVVPAGISTGRTRERARNEPRRRAGATKKEKDHAQAEYERNYIKDHS